MIILLWFQLLPLFLVRPTNCDTFDSNGVIETNRTYTLDNLSNFNSVRITTNRNIDTQKWYPLELSQYRFLSKHKSEFMTGFALGLFAFAVKKMLLPLVLGAQVIKSILIAIFLPSILGGIGKFLGKGLKKVSSSGFPNSSGQDTAYKDFNFDNNSPPEVGDHVNFNYPEPSTTSSIENTLHYNDQISRLGAAADGSNQYYSYQQFPNKKIPNYKTMQRISESSSLLINYDPFYSPLLSRLDSIFQKLYIDQTEPCREKLICQMYANPVKFAPYSNFVSAQLSKELYELRRPTSDSPEILRFFKYLKAGKLGQDDATCNAYRNTCPSLNTPVPALLTTYNEINKLVLARKLQPKKHRRISSCFGEMKKALHGSIKENQKVSRNNYAQN